MKTWSSAEAKRHFSELIQGVQTGPQIIELRGKPVGVVISYQDFSKNPNWRGEKTWSEWFAELEEIHETEGDMEDPPRLDRPDPFGADWS